ncbi:affinity cationic amino acid transporter 1 [Seminavis robusta]|uniref:Affinity cationic amino acid transporter 1 n=1 Tax=Seminavis robusta TaxID=568900 RepID=A0A9N8DF25_9STRA|nr:affinity cationic amino acid transporter 1 [Seminavis robusta]|eukprot:Sro58_g033930.1 affinity cationic amino acid transporter 1 (660) ;mRNA; f:132760-134825
MVDLSSFSVRALTRRRPVTTTPSSTDAEASQALKRSLNAVDLIFYGVGCSVGAGIYSLVGIGANTAGPAIAFSFAFAGVACVFTSLSYAEFASLLKTAGSAYTYAYVSFGELAGWLVGWNLTLGYAVSAAVVARSWAEYTADFIGSFIPEQFDAHYLHWLTKMPLPAMIVGEDYTCCPLSMLIIGICTLVLVTGVKESAKFNLIMTILNLGVLALVLCMGTPVISTDNWFPVFPHGISGMAQGAGLIFFAYLGFDMVSCLSEEVINPEVNLPLGIIGSLAVSLCIYVAVAAVVVGMAPTTLLGEDVPIINALLSNACCRHTDQLLEDAAQKCLSYECNPVLHPLLYLGSRVVSVGGIFGLTTATFTCLMGQPRIFYSIAQDGLFFKIYSRVDPKTGVPFHGTIITGVLVAFIACLFDLESLANTISLGTLQVFTFVNAGVILLRMRLSNAPDPGEEELSPLVPKSPISRDPEADFVARSLGLRKETSIEIRKSLRNSAIFISSRDNDTKPIWYVTAFTLAALALSVSVSTGCRWGSWIAAASVVAMAASTILLYSLPQSPPTQSFACPGFPGVPLLGILCNCYMMGSMQAQTWGLISGWLFIGLLFYFGYGIHNSNLRVKDDGRAGLSNQPKSSGSQETKHGLIAGRRLKSYDSTKPLA